MAQSSKDHCLKDLQRRILATDLQPGQDLDEAGLTQTYGISRTPLREILQRLQGEGYVTLSQNRGAKVSPMDIGTLRKFFQTAPLIYANVARLAAEASAKADLDSLKAAQLDFRDAVEASRAGEAAWHNHRFHAIIGGMSDNPYLAASLERLLIDHTRLSQTFYRPVSEDDRGRVLRAIDQHDAMIAAFEDSDGERAVALTLEHWDLSRDQMERFVRPDPLPIDVPTSKDKQDAF